MRADHRFPVMGTTAHVIVVDGPDDLATEAESRLRRLERRWSRFLADSDVGRLNRADGHAVAVAPETIVLLDRAVTAWAATDGAFDPTVHDAVVAAGYDRTFPDLPADTTTARTTPGAAPGCAGIVIDPDAATARLPRGVRLDPGGIGKGLAADLVVGALADRAGGLAVDVGGDVRLTGQAPSGGAWSIALESRPDLVLTVEDGAVATSSTRRRTWTVAGQRRHHVVDPRRGEVAMTSLTDVTVVAATGWWAEAAATAALLGPTAGDARRVLAGRVEAAVIVSADGTTDVVGPLEESTPWIRTCGGTSPVPAASSPGR